MIVITLSKVPLSLRGDLTKWCQEIQTGVYVGNVNAKIRALLWQRILKNMGQGEATLVYTTNNELGYNFETNRKDCEVVDYDGIPLMRHLKEITAPIKHGFSNAAHYHRARKYAHRQVTNFVPFVAVDVETTGLNIGQDELLSIGAFKRGLDTNLQTFYHLIKGNQKIPASITSLTHISKSLLEKEGEKSKKVLSDLQDFMGNLPLVGYNLPFDLGFLNKNFRKNGLNALQNKTVDLLPVVKENDQFLDNYQLGTVLKKYQITNLHPHNALSDAKVTFLLAEKLIKNGILKI